MSIKSIRSVVNTFNSKVSLSIFCLDNLSFGDSGILKSHITLLAGLSENLSSNGPMGSKSSSLGVATTCVWGR